MNNKILIFILINFFLISCNSAEDNHAQKPSSQQSSPKQQNIKQTFQNGDLIFHTSQSSQSKAIQIATNSKFSHMGIIFQEAGKNYVFEAVQPVKITKLEEWIKRGQNGEYIVKRLKNSEQYLTKEGIQKMKLIGSKYLGKDYDLRFEWSDDKMYCSELVWKIYKEAFNIRIGELEKFKDFDLSNPIVKNKVKERYGDKIPQNELVITPDKMFKSKKLIQIKI